MLPAKTASSVVVLRLLISSHIKRHAVFGGKSGRKSFIAEVGLDDVGKAEDFALFVPEAISRHKRGIVVSTVGTQLTDIKAAPLGIKKK